MFPFHRVVRVQSIVAVVWGSAMLLAPRLVVGLLGAETDAAGLLVARVAGGTWFGLGVTLTASWTAEDPEVRRRLAVANSAAYAGLAMALFGGVMGDVTHGFVAWMSVVFFTFASISWLGTTRA